MDRLFSRFNPNSILGLQLNWVSIFFILLVCSKFWKQNRLLIFLKKLLSTIHLDLRNIFKPEFNWGQTHFFISLFLFIFLINFIGIFPYIFTRTSHLVIALFLALPLWLGSQTYSWIFITNSIFCHLVPERTPFLLIPLLVIIETVRNIIRPITLSVRLVANITAGHLLLSLLGRGASPGGPLGIISTILIGLVILVGLELGVSFIQAYVFTLLRAIYLGEVDYWGNKKE